MQGVGGAGVTWFAYQHRGCSFTGKRDATTWPRSSPSPRQQRGPVLQPLFPSPLDNSMAPCYCLAPPPALDNSVAPCYTASLPLPPRQQHGPMLLPRSFP